LKNLSRPENQKDKQQERTIKESIFNPSRDYFTESTGKKQAKKREKLTGVFDSQYPTERENAWRKRSPNTSRNWRKLPNSAKR